MKTEDDLAAGNGLPDSGADSSPRTTDSVPAPKPLTYLVDLPEPLGYRIKNKLLGPPLHNDRLAHERLGKPTALAVFASDCISSSAYASEEILRSLLPFIGILAFSMLLPITFSILIVLFFLILSYRQTIKEYPSAGGAYIVTKDNFGLLPAQVAGVALLTDYILTVSVSVAAGSAAIGSAIPAVAPYILPMAIFFVVLIAAVNLKGVKESGLVFSVPTYFFIVNMVVLAGVGLYKALSGGLVEQAIPAEGVVEVSGGNPNLFLYGATIFVVLRAFASGGAAVTGVEAISNGVPAFREPAWRNARVTLVIMGFIAGGMFLTVSVLASKVHAVPYESGTPTVISQVGQFVYGSDAGGVPFVLWISLQIGTMLILVLAANTSFADFPRLASFHAGDNFMPRQLTKRGHRLVFSNGIISLAVAAIVLLIVTGAQVDRLIPLYAIGVFLSFTLSQAGMARHHIKKKEPKWQLGIFVNGMGAFLSAVVCVIIAITKFSHGAWFILILVPVLVVLLVRLNKQYESEEVELEEDAPKAVEAPVMRRHVVLVLIDSLDMAAARAIQYARALTPDELVAVHFDMDPIRSEDLTDKWGRLGFDRLALDVVECPDRRIERGATEIVTRYLADHQTEVSVLIPRHEYSRFWHRLVHDRTADSLVKALSTLPHCNVTIVPYHLGSRGLEDELVVPDKHVHTAARPARTSTAVVERPVAVEGQTAIADLYHRERAEVRGKVYSMRVQPWSGVAALELVITDGTGALTVVFFGRRRLAGVRPGTNLVVKGMVADHRGVMAMLNPSYEIDGPSTIESH